jgi:phosphoribosylanthranilate isomerase
MDSLKIFAANVGNLSDARYFSAWEVDYLGFDLHPYNEEKWQKALAMAEWIEGPVIVMPENEKLPSKDSETILPLLEWNEHKVDFPDGSFFCILPTSFLLDYEHKLLPKNGIYIFSLSTQTDAIYKDALKSFCKLFQVFIDADIPADNLSEMINTFQPSGLVIRGGEEEKPGFKSFDELDDWFEAISSFRLK